MILSHEDLSAIEKTLGAHQAGPIVQALEKLDKEQRVEVKRDLLIELATKADIVRMEGKIDHAARLGRSGCAEHSESHPKVLLEHLL